MTSQPSTARRRLAFALRAAAVFALSLALPAAAQERLAVELQVVDALRPLLAQHLRILNREVVVPESRADRAALVRRTRRDVANLLATEGYFTPEVRLDRSEAGRWVLQVEPGDRTLVDSVEITFEGHLAADDAALAERRAAFTAAWPLKSGMPFRQADWDSAKVSLLDGVAVRDYAAARIAESRAEVDPERARAKLTVRVDSGPPFRLGPIKVIGIERLPEGLVSRYGRLTEGERFDQERLLAFQSTLQNAPQFASVVVDIRRDPALADAVPVEVHVSEADSRHLSMGAGYSTNTGARAELGWRDVNLRGRAWELSTGLRLEQRRQSLYADLFMSPSLDGHRNSFGVLVDASEISGLDTRIQAIGATRSELRGDIETAIGLRYQRESLRPAGAERSNQNALTANWKWMQRKVDNVLDPRAGRVLQFEVGGGARALLSDQDFVRGYGRVAWYMPMRGTDVLILRAEAGITLANSRDGIPQDFLFRAGGSQSVRGYAFQSLGVPEGDATLGGRFLATASAEYVHWLTPQWGVAAFIDAGDAADDRDSFDARIGYGLGARWASPAGPLALDLAYGHNEERLRLHFAIAIAF